MKIQVKIGETTFTATLQENTTAAAFKEMELLTLSINDLNRNEKYYNFSDSLPTAASSPGIIRNRDLMLYGCNCLVLFYKTFSSSYSYTRIGVIEAQKHRDLNDLKNKPLCFCASMSVFYFLSYLSFGTPPLFYPFQGLLQVFLKERYHLIKRYQIQPVI